MLGMTPGDARLGAVAEAQCTGGAEGSRRWRQTPIPPLNAACEARTTNANQRRSQDGDCPEPQRRASGRKTSSSPDRGAGTTAAAGPSDVYVFGATVLAAQVWGLSVETLYQAVERRHNSANRDLYDEPPAARAPTALIDALRASFHDLELLDELAELAELQDLIANRYLRVRHNTGAVSPLFDHQARAELSTIALRFISPSAACETPTATLPPSTRSSRWSPL